MEPTTNSTSADTNAPGNSPNGTNAPAVPDLPSAPATFVEPGVAQLYVRGRADWSQVPDPDPNAIRDLEPYDPGPFGFF